MNLTEIAVLAAHTLCLGLLVLYGLHRSWLVLQLRLHASRLDRPGRGEADGPLPSITLQLPLYNERRVVGRLIRAVGNLDYPAGRLEVQVLDDSTDATTRVAAAGVRWLRSRGIRAFHIRRARRDGFKAGALEEGRRSAAGEMIAVLDADFVPPPGLLKALAAGFDHPRIGMVQARWEHLNRDEGMLTRVQAAMLDGHFVVEHASRAAAGRFFNFNGTAGMWRRECLEDAGGWRAATLTEDLELSYRAQMLGWRFRYLPRVTAPAELPSCVEDFKTQQRRWAQGSIQTCRIHLARLLRARLPWEPGWRPPSTSRPTSATP